VLLVLLCVGCYHGTHAQPGDGTVSLGTEGGTGEASEGDTESDGGDGPGGQQLPECDPLLVPPEVALRRLTKQQYVNTVGDLFAWATGSDAASVLAELEPRFAAFPDDERVAAAGHHLGGFRRMDQSVQQRHVDAAYAVGVAVAQTLTSPTWLATVAGTCATDDDASNDSACVDEFIERFGQRALRRPLDDVERAHYRAVFDADGLTVGTPPEAFADVITALMIAPQFMYMMEHGAEPVAALDDVYALSSWELASRLSYHFRHTMPDEALAQAAADGSLATEEGYAEQVDRMLADARARAVLREFFREWLWLDDVPAVGVLAAEGSFAEFVGDTPIDDATRENIIEETLDMALYYTFDVRGTLRDLMLSDRSFATTPDVAAIYGTPVWEDGDPPTLPQPDRVGLLTRASRLVNGTPRTRPIMKGVFIRIGMLCDLLPPPPPTVDMTLPDLAGATTRELVERLTERDPSCAGCHASLINGIGFVTEQYDALGRHRTQERIFDVDGNVVDTKPVDTAAVPRIDLDDDAVISDPRTMAEAILASGKLQACFARHHVRFTFARDEDVELDACVLQDIAAAVDEDAPLIEVLRAIALSDAFRRRSIAQ
jgi:hypothetical protein